MKKPKEPPKHITCEASWALLDEPQIVLNKDKLFDTETLEEEVDINTLKGILNTTSPDDKWEDDLMASLMVFHTHSMLSRMVYNEILLIMTLSKMKLPVWAIV
ncbi:hypothetical protein VP01_829g2 [Puccinia sorghi]|uniref:Uncharacterized protein n=1 Tax=Puccinia sorghi TaxID=27349 RepID=A0A0L6U9V0_9BASI|nr:hypothetical protein VP01_829g2 [Puccinia sorghi]